MNNDIGCPAENVWGSYWYTGKPSQDAALV